MAQDRVDAVGARLEVQPCTLHSVVDVSVAFSVTAHEDVDARVEHDVHTFRARRQSHRRQPFGLTVRVAQDLARGMVGVFEVAPDGACLEHAPHECWGVEAVAGFEVGGEWHVDDTCDARHSAEDLVQR